MSAERSSIYYSGTWPEAFPCHNIDKKSPEVQECGQGAILSLSLAHLGWETQKQGAVKHADVYADTHTHGLWEGREE